jgi:predicted DNA-binding ribbon-helix-helix protein
MNKKKSSRFDELIDAARSRQQRDNLQLKEEQSTGTKSTDPNYTRTTIYLPKQLHRQLKSVAASQERQMSDIVTELVEEWLKSKEGK